MRLRLPVVIVNFKTYSQATGEKALALALEIERAAVVSNKVDHVAIAVQPCDLLMIASKVRIAVFSQHVDPVSYGSFTGSILPEAVQKAGACGTLINHAEKQVSPSLLRETVKRCKVIGLISVVCANNPDKAAEFSRLVPDFIADEPPELIGKGVSVSEAEPEVVRRTVKKVRAEGNVPVLCGAGIHSGKDFYAAVKLGSKGILLSSGVVLSENPFQVMRDILSVLK